MQFAIYNNYNPVGVGCSASFFMGIPQRTESILDQYAGNVKDVHGAHPFELHLIFLDTAIASWRPYLIYLAERMYLIEI